MIIELPIDALRRRVRSLYRDASTAPKNPILLLRACDELQTALELLQVMQNATQEHENSLAARNTQLTTEHADYQQLFAFAPDAYIVTSLDGTIHKANNAALAMFNQAADQIVGRPIGMFVPEGERRPFRAALVELAAVEQQEDWHLRLQRNTGEVFVASANVVRVCNSLQRPTALRWQIRDVTRQQATITEQQRRIEALEQRLQMLEQRGSMIDSLSKASPNRDQERLRSDSMTR